MVFILLCCLHLAIIVGSKDNSKNVYMTKPIITRGCHMVSLDTHSLMINNSLEHNNVTNCYQFCFFNNSGLTVNALLMKGMECVCAATTSSTSFDTATRCTERCPGNANENCGGNDTNAYAVYEIENTSSNIQNEGCGHVPLQIFSDKQNLEYGDCSEKKRAYCTMLDNIDGTRIISRDLTWDQHYNDCIGHLAFINDTKDVQSTDVKNLSPSSRFWVGHRIWTFVSSNSKHLTDTTCISVSPKTEKKNSSDDSLTDTTSVSPKAEKKDDPSHLTLITAVSVSVIAILILLTIVCIKRRKANLNSSKQRKNDSSKDAYTVPLQPISEQTNQDHDYDHLHENPAIFPTDNVYDVSGKCPDEPNIDDNVYNTSKQCSGHEMYDSSINNPQKSENIMNSDMYSTMSRNNGGECPKDMNLYDHTSTSAQNNDRTEIYNEIDT